MRNYFCATISAPTPTPRYDARGVDIWCAGVVLYAMVTGKMPFRGEDVNATLDIIRAKEPDYPEQLSPEITVRGVSAGVPVHCVVSSAVDVGGGVVGVCGLCKRFVRTWYQHSFKCKVFPFRGIRTWE